MPLHVDRRDAVAVLTLDDPERRNALSPEMVAAIVATVAALGADDSVGAWWSPAPGPRSAPAPT